MLQTIVLPIVRHLLGMFGGTLAGSGVVSENDANLLTGAILTVIAIGWSIAEKLIAKNKAG
jgi:hypothetical protein